MSEGKSQAAEQNAAVSETWHSISDRGAFGDHCRSLFNRFGYYGTDSNQIEKEAGYATCSIHEHFKHNRETFLAVYEAWVTSEWLAIAEEHSVGRKPEEVSRKAV
jgi:AcrR family transcriptional regulator